MSATPSSSSNQSQPSNSTHLPRGEVLAQASTSTGWIFRLVKLSSDKRIIEFAPDRGHGLSDVDIEPIIRKCVKDWTKEYGDISESYGPDSLRKIVNESCLIAMRTLGVDSFSSREEFDPRDVDFDQLESNEASSSSSIPSLPPRLPGVSVEPTFNPANVIYTAQASEKAATDDRATHTEWKKNYDDEVTDQNKEIKGSGYKILHGSGCCNEDLSNALQLVLTGNNTFNDVFNLDAIKEAIASMENDGSKESGLYKGSNILLNGTRISCTLAQLRNLLTIAEAYEKRDNAQNLSNNEQNLINRAELAIMLAQDPSLWPGMQGSGDILRDTLNAISAANRLDIMAQHQPIERLCGHFEQLARFYGSRDGVKAAQCASLASQTVANLRLLSREFEKYNKLINNTENPLSVGKALGYAATSIYVWEPIVSTLCLGALIYFTLSQEEQEPVTPLQAESFYRAMNHGLIPMLQAVYRSLKQGQEELGAQADKNAAIQIEAIGDMTDSFVKQLESHTKGLHEHLTSDAFDKLVMDSTQALKDYRAKLLPLKNWLKNDIIFPEPNTEMDYFNASLEFLSNARANDMHGYNGDRTPLTFDEASVNPIYATGFLHKTLTGEEQLPVHLPALDTVAYTFLCYMEKHLSKSMVLFSLKGKRQFKTLLKRLSKAVEEQQTLFDRIDGLYKALCDHHQTLITTASNNKRLAEMNLADTQSKMVLQSVESLENTLAERVVGREMFHWSNLPHQKMNLQKMADKIYNVLYRKEMLAHYCALTFPIIYGAKIIDDVDATATGTFHTISKEVCSSIESASSASMCKQIPTIKGIKLDWGTELYYKAKIQYSVWSSDKGEFQANVDAAAPSMVPIFGVALPLSLVMTRIHTSKAKKPANPTIAFTATYLQETGKITVKVDDDSVLQENDIKGIPYVSEDCAQDRESLMQDVLEGLRGDKIAADNPILKDLALATPIAPQIFEFPVLPVASNLLEHFTLNHCNERKAVMMNGDSIQPDYTFEKEGAFYTVKLWLRFDGAGKSLRYRSRSIFKVDEDTVNAFSKPGQKPHIAELLYCMLFGGNYANEGMPNKNTYINTGKGILAPQLTRFPSLLKLQNQFPHLDFVFDHRLYDEKARQALEHALKTGQINEVAAQFFRLPETSVDPKNYLEVQSLIRESMKRAEASPENQAFKETYAQFMALGQLVSAHDKTTLQNLLFQNAGIIAPGQLGAVEQAAFYRPRSEEDLEVVPVALARRPSLAKKRLQAYARQLNVLEDLLEGRIDEHQAAARIGFSNRKKTRAHLIEDMKKNSEKGKKNKGKERATTP